MHAKILHNLIDYITNSIPGKIAVYLQGIKSGKHCFYCFPNALYLLFSILKRIWTTEKKCPQNFTLYSGVL